MTFRDALERKYLVWDQVSNQEDFKHDEINLTIKNDGEIKTQWKSKLEMKGKVRKF